MIESVRAFNEYFDGVRRRTVGFFRMIPPDAIDWAPKAGEYTCGDIVRHVAASEAMFTGVVADGVWRYEGHGRGLGATLPETLALLDARHEAASRALAAAGDAALAQSRPALEPGGRPIRGWRVLMAMCEHEVHHRSQLASYLTLMGVEAPGIFGLGVEDVQRLATGAPATSLTADPTSGTADPASGTADPTSGTTDPTSGTADPTSATTDPTSGTADPASGTAEPTSGTADPTSGAPTISLRPPTPGTGNSAPIQRRSE